MVQVTEDCQPPDPEYWEEIMPQFDLDGATPEANLIVEEVSCNMIEPESENDESQSDQESCSEKFNCQLCTPTQCDTPLHTEQLMTNEISSRSEDLTVKACANGEAVINFAPKCSFSINTSGCNQKNDSSNGGKQMHNFILPTHYVYDENKALSASMMTHAPNEEFDTFDSDDTLSFDDDMTDDEIQLLCNKTTDINLSVQGSKNSGHLSPLSSTFLNGITDIL